MTKLNSLQYDALSSAVQHISNESGINIYTMNDRFGNEEPLEYGVNWYACGTQNAQNTMIFAKNLQEVAQIAQMLTDMEITYTYDKKEPTIDKETYHKYVKAITEMIKLDIPEMVKEVLNKMA